MRIYLKALGAVRMRIGQTGDTNVPENITLQELKEYLGLPVNYPLMFTINGVYAQAEDMVKENDIVALITPASAG